MEDNYKRVEYLLYNHRAFQGGVEILEKEIEYLKVRDDIREIGGINYSEEKTSGTNKISSIVESTVLSISEKMDYLERNIKRNKLNIEKIDTALTVLSEVEKDIIVKRYFENKEWYTIGYEVSYHEASCRRMRKQAMQKLIITLFGGCSV